MLHRWAVVDRLTREILAGTLEDTYWDAQACFEPFNAITMRVTLPDGKTAARYAVVRVRLEYDFARRYMAARMPKTNRVPKVGDPGSDAGEPGREAEPDGLTESGGASSDMQRAG